MLLTDEFRAALPFVLGIVFQVGVAAGVWTVQRDARMEFPKQQDADLRFVRLVDASQVLAAMPALAIAGLDIRYLPVAFHGLIVAVAVSAGIASYVYLRRKSDNRYDELTHIGLTWLNQVLIIGNVVLAALAVFLVAHHHQGRPSCATDSHCHTASIQAAPTA